MPQVVVDLGSGGTGRLSKLLPGSATFWPGLLPVSYPFCVRPTLAFNAASWDERRLSGIQTAKPPLNNPAVRHALALAIKTSA